MSCKVGRPRQVQLRTIGCALVCILAVLNAGTSLRAQERSVTADFEVSVNCELAPYRHCVLSISGKGSAPSVDPAQFMIDLKSKNIFIPSGQYRSKWRVESRDGHACSYDVELRIAQKRAHLVVKSRVWKALQRRSRWKGEYFIWKSESLPLAISDLTVKRGDIRATLMYHNLTVGSSQDTMWPAKGCWLNEVQCVPH